MTAVPIPGTLRVQCKCGWQGTTEDLMDKTCPICGEAFKAWPANLVSGNIIDFDPIKIKGGIDGLFGRMPAELQKLLRKLADAPNYDFAAMELLDAFKIEWRE